MVHTFEIRNTLHLSPERVLALRLDQQFDQAMASLEQQILHVPSTHELTDGRLHKVAEIELPLERIPKVFRSLWSSSDNRIVCDDTFHPAQGPRETKLQLPGKLGQLLQVRGPVRLLDCRHAGTAWAA